MSHDRSLNRDGVTLHWREDGEPSAPPLLLLNSLGTDLRMWEPVTQHLSASHRVLRMDMRGHGRSSTPPGDASIQALAQDAFAVLDAAGLTRASLCGLSIGGMIAMQMALDLPDRIEALVVANSSAEVPAAAWSARADLVRSGGMQAVVDMVIPRFFSDAFRDSAPDVVDQTRQTLLATNPEGYAAACMAIARLDLISRLPQLRQRLLVINGALDSATPPPSHGERIAALVPGAKQIALPAGHISALECPAAFADAVTAFLSDADG